VRKTHGARPVPGRSGPERGRALSILANSPLQTSCERGPFAPRLRFSCLLTLLPIQYRK